MLTTLRLGTLLMAAMLTTTVLGANSTNGAIHSEFRDNGNRDYSVQNFDYRDNHNPDYCRHVKFPGCDEGHLKNIVDTVRSKKSLRKLSKALRLTQLDTVLADESEIFTVFAPTNAAFRKLGRATLAPLFKDPQALSDLLLYHVIPDASVDAATAVSLAGTTVTMANGDGVAITLEGDKLFINDSQVTVTDIQASNGVIHIIDTVLTEPEPEPETLNIVDTLIADGSFTVFVDGLQAIGLDSDRILRDDTIEFTVFAPTDAAFEKLGQSTIDALFADRDDLRDTLQYHIYAVSSIIDSTRLISLADETPPTLTMSDDFNSDVAFTVEGDRLFINQSEITVTDVQTSNGIIHIIDTVLVQPPSRFPPEDGLQSAFDTLVAAGSFNILAEALLVTGLADRLSDANGRITILAPTDEAFAKLPEGTLEALLADPETLTDILLYHVIDGYVVSNALWVDIGSSVTMANGDDVDISYDRRQGFLINDSVVTGFNVHASNFSIIHVIDTVLIPPAE